MRFQVVIVGVLLVFLLLASCSQTASVSSTAVVLESPLDTIGQENFSQPVVLNASVDKPVVMVSFE